MAKRSTSHTILDFISQLVDVFFKSANTKKRTWHQHVVPFEDDWAIRREGNKKITSKHRKQETAIRKAQVLATKYKADVIIHRKSGGIRDRISFND